MSVAGEPWCVGVGTGRDKDGHDLMRIAAMAGPVVEEMELGARAGALAVFHDPDAGEPWMLDAPDLVEGGDLLDVVPGAKVGHDISVGPALARLHDRHELVEVVLVATGH